MFFTARGVVFFYAWMLLKAIQIERKRGIGEIHLVAGAGGRGRGKGGLVKYTWLLA